MIIKNLSRGACKVATCAGLLMASSQSYGAGFAIIEQSVSGLGNAFAGGAAAAEDATTIYYNPAGLTRLPGNQFVGGAHVVVPSTKFSNEASNVPGSNGRDARQTVVVPNLYYAHRVNDHWNVGLGVNAPFGLATEYNSDWYGRYQAIRSELKTVNINPAVAYKATEQLSIGAGVSFQYADAELSNAIDFRALGAPDGFTTLKGDDWGYGFNLGLLYEPDQATRFGLAYRSKINYTLSGDVTFENIPAPLFPLFTDTGAKADLATPETVSISGFRQIDSKWAVMGDATWTRWDRFQELRVVLDKPVVLDPATGSPTNVSVTPEHWENTWRYALGLNYQYNTQWKLRAGVAYDETPIPSAEFRTPRIPGNNRKWIALGAGYQSSDNLRFDLGYAHLFVSDTPINNTDGAGHNLNGTYQSDVNIVSAQVQWAFN